jgi:hypothetical protein
VTPSGTDVVVWGTDCHACWYGFKAKLSSTASRILFLAKDTWEAKCPTEAPPLALSPVRLRLNVTPSLTARARVKLLAPLAIGLEARNRLQRGKLGALTTGATRLLGDCDLRMLTWHTYLPLMQTGCAPWFSSGCLKSMGMTTRIHGFTTGFCHPSSNPGIWIYMYIGICTCVYIYTYVYTCTSVYIRIGIHICVWTIPGRQHGYTMHLQTPTPDIKSSPPLFNPSLHMHVCMHKYMYVRIYTYKTVYLLRHALE